MRQKALSLLRGGAPYQVVADQLNVPRGTVGYWLHVDRFKRGECPGRTPAKCCPRCDGLPLDRRVYAYLLGLYLGDGHIVSKYRQHTLAIYCDDHYPALKDLAEAALRAVLPECGTGRVQRPGCTEVKSYSSHWQCLFPQHGPGKKHNRPIVLEPWQQDIVAEHPWELIRGLIHSDGCRVTNWTTKIVQGRVKRYEYPRYFFTNLSADIIGIYTDALDLVGVEWTMAAKNRGRIYDISVARKASVALMETHVGAKY
ncbi:hypothetical protein BIV57_21740 [Mangrovactinospora gilvigrisea]|uniref:Transcriptional regulator n=1 Tax=Mangrovactinospora gilvigrisea TaxID=1428644 RepID=A0A1J7C1H3_9ACTN|nr:helix-turn-helix domain-containing protein [Mangrovactinospora gilvigrisea]OIV35416.1 hypothetical protein BIV57_21740 [Mangrovactinospora gilvigrisea]